MKKNFSNCSYLPSRQLTSQGMSNRQNTESIRRNHVSYSQLFFSGLPMILPHLAFKQISFDTIIPCHHVIHCHHATSSNSALGWWPSAAAADRLCLPRRPRAWPATRRFAAGCWAWCNQGGWSCSALLGLRASRGDFFTLTLEPSFQSRPPACCRGWNQLRRDYTWVFSVAGGLLLGGTGGLERSTMEQSYLSWASTRVHFLHFKNLNFM